MHSQGDTKVILYKYSRYILIHQYTSLHITYFLILKGLKIDLYWPSKLDTFWHWIKVNCSRICFFAEPLPWHRFSKKKTWLSWNFYNLVNGDFTLKKKDFTLDTEFQIPHEVIGSGIWDTEFQIPREVIGWGIWVKIHSF